MTDKPKVAEVNIETGITTIRDFTDEEIKAHAEHAEKSKALYAQWEAEAQAKAEAKASALAKLEALGLTEEEAKAIVG